MNDDQSLMEMHDVILRGFSSVIDEQIRKIKTLSMKWHDLICAQEKKRKTIDDALFTCQIAFERKDRFLRRDEEIIWQNQEFSNSIRE